MQNNKKPKILISLMSCNSEIYKIEENIVKDTYIKQIFNFDNIDYIIFDCIDNETYYDNNEHILHINGNDDIYYTYEKNIKYFQWLNDNNYKYDYLIRTNLSTFINIPLLNDYLTYIHNNVKDNRIMYIESHICDNIFMITGKFMIFQKHHIDILLNNIIDSPHIYYDDFMFCKVFQQYYCNENNLNYHELCSDNNTIELSKFIINTYKEIPVLYINDIPSRMNNVLLDNITYDVLKNIIAINTKPYANNDLNIIKSSFLKLNNLVNTNYLYDINNIYNILTFNCGLYSHNQNKQQMFVLTPIYNIIIYIITLTDDILNNMYNYINQYKSINKLVLCYDNDCRIDKNIISNKLELYHHNQEDNINKSVYDIYKTFKFNEYHYCVVSYNNYINLNRLHNSVLYYLTDYNFDNHDLSIISNLYYNLMEYNNLIFIDNNQYIRYITANNEKFNETNHNVLPIKIYK